MGASRGGERDEGNDEEDEINEVDEVGRAAAVRFLPSLKENLALRPFQTPTLHKKIIPQFSAPLFR